jgi:hypothetical protein
MEKQTLRSPPCARGDAHSKQPCGKSDDKAAIVDACQSERLVVDQDHLEQMARDRIPNPQIAIVARQIGPGSPGNSLLRSLPDPAVGRCSPRAIAGMFSLVLRSSPTDPGVGRCHGVVHKCGIEEVAILARPKAGRCLDKYHSWQFDRAFEILGTVHLTLLVGLFLAVGKGQVR